MSSPLSSLSKNRKTPLFFPEMSTPSPLPKEPEKTPHIGINSGYSYKSTVSNNSSCSNFDPLPNIKSKSNESSKNNFVPFKSYIDESDLIDEFTTQMAVNNLKKKISTSQTSNAPNDLELMQLMMSKIKQAENKCAILEREITRKDKKIEILEEKLDLYKKQPTNSRDDVIEDLKLKNCQLMSQISEMEAFLADYGLHWVGNESDLNSNSKNEQTKTPEDMIDFKIDYDLMVKNIKELNSLMDSNDIKIVEFNDNKVKFEHSESIKLTLFSNGIALYNGPFRSFDQSITKKFCIDIMDGYFPSELQDKYPDGVKFDLIDKRDIFYKQEKNSVFNSKGYRLGSARISNTLTENITSNEPILESKKNFETSLIENPITVDQFLNKLPLSVVKSGKVYGIRNELLNEIKGIDLNSNKTNLPETEKDETNNDEILKSDKITTLKIKQLSNSDKPVVIKMAYTDTIKNLKDKIKSIKKLKLSKDFDVASVYPRKIFDNLQMTLEDCDLVPNSNVIIIQKK